MTFDFRPATRAGDSLLICVAGPSGGGKTYTAMLLARGIMSVVAPGKRFAVIDTERRRSLIYADSFAFDMADLEAPFSPARYVEAIKAADDAGYPVIVVDSASHSWEGEGGVLEMQEAEHRRLGGGENVKLLSWNAPKREMKKMILASLRTRATIIYCLRADEKVEPVKEDGKTVIKPKKTLTSVLGWIPICDKRLPFEMTVSALVLPNRPGFPHWIKRPEPLHAILPADEALGEASGARLAHWAKGKGASTQPASHTQAGVASAAVIVDDWRVLIGEAPDADALAATWTRCNAACRAAGDKAALEALTKAKDERKVALGLA